METRVDLLVQRCLELKGDTIANLDKYSYGPSRCLRCKEPIKAEGQEAGVALATEYGLVFRVKIPCRCGCATGFVVLEPDEDGSEAA